MRWASRTRLQPRSPEERLASLTVGDWVVCGSYGLGRVAVKETRAVGGAEREVVVVELGDGLLVTLPLERALGCLRLVADQAELEVVQRILRGSVIDEQAWQKRLRVAREKVSMGHRSVLPKASGIAHAEKRGLAAAGRGSRRPSMVFTRRPGNCSQPRSAVRSVSQRPRQTTGSTNNSQTRTTWPRPSPRRP